MLRPAVLLLVLVTGCAHSGKAAAPVVAAAPVPEKLAPAPPKPGPAPAPEPPAPVAAQLLEEELGEEDLVFDGTAGLQDEGEEGTVDPAGDGTGLPRYTAELSDERLEALWTGDLASLGSVSFGLVTEGRLLNGVQFPEDPAWRVVSPAKAWGTQETVDYVVTAIREVRRRYPDAPPLRVNQLSGPEGGFLRPHKSHQNGRDVDLGFYYPTAAPIRMRARERYIDVEKNWALVKALVTLTDVKVILVDRRVQRVLYRYALEAGEDREWLDSLFNAGHRSLIKHARRHRDHFHVRFYNGRAQELGRRLTPLLALRPEQNIVMHRVRRGDTLSELAVRYNTTVRGIRRANRMRGSLLRVRQVLKIPLRKPCNQCPLPPVVLIPERRLPPTPAAPTARNLMAPPPNLAAAAP